MSIEPFVTNTDRDVFALRGLPEETIAYLFARYSRSPDGLRTMLAECLADESIPSEPVWEQLLALIKDSPVDTSNPNHPRSPHQLSAMEYELTTWLEHRNQTPERARQLHEKFTIGYGHACYSDDTEVLTDHGWVLWPDYVNSDRRRPLATWLYGDPDLSYTYPVAVHKYSFYGQLHRYSNHQTDLLVTPNHRLYGDFTNRTHINKDDRRPVFLTSDGYRSWRAHLVNLVYHAPVFPHDPATHRPPYHDGTEAFTFTGYTRRFQWNAFYEPELIEYEGMVYCASLPDTGTVIVRRGGGLAVVCGNSVAEHAVCHLAVENCSILAAKAIEDCRLASYTEKSTRYVPLGPDSYHIPTEIRHSNGALAITYANTCRQLLETYQTALDKLPEQLAQRFPQPEGWTPQRYQGVLQARACDIARYLLPTATRTNLGITVNARSLRGMIIKLLSSPLAELEALGEALREEGAKIVPTLLRYTEPAGDLEVMANTAASFAHEQGLAPQAEAGSGVWLLNGSEATATSIAGAALAYLHNQRRFDPTMTHAQRLVELVLDQRGEHAPLPRAFELIPLTFELCCDYGAWRDLQRHRMATFLTQPLSPLHGYETPLEVEELVVEGYHEAMDSAAESYTQIADAINETVAQYVLPMAYRVRCLLQVSLREAAHIIELRSRPQGHPAYRHLAVGMWRALGEPPFVRVKE
jgi:thymidylate synthase ThyX